MFLSFKRELEAELRLEKKKARQEGIQEGVLEDSLEGARETRLDTARRMLQRGMAPSLVAELTDLSPEEIAALLN
jgi:predicted transposase/invertase (TIGR01784 family)